MKITTAVITAGLLVPSIATATSDPAYPVATERATQRWSAEIPDNQWGMYTIPSSRPETLSALLGDVLPLDEYGRTWAAFTYRDGAYSQPDLYERIDPMLGFWLLQRTGEPVTISFDGEVQLAVDRLILTPLCTLVGGGSSETMKITTDEPVAFFGWDIGAEKYTSETGERFPPGVGYWACTRIKTQLYGQLEAQPKKR